MPMCHESFHPISNSRRDSYEHTPTLYASAFRLMGDFSLTKTAENVSVCLQFGSVDQRASNVLRALNVKYPH